MLKFVKQLSLRTLQTAGTFDRVMNSEWRRRRLLILCYHGVSIEDEHEWRPPLYVQPMLLEQRFEALKDWRCAVLPLGEAIDRLYCNSLPPRAVALTFDDGGYDFYAKAYPLLKKYRFPATVYQTTYYSECQQPIFHLMCSYLLWKKRGELLRVTPLLPCGSTLDLRTEQSRQTIVDQLVMQAEGQQLSAEQRNDMAAELAGALGIDYKLVLQKRILQLMTPQEISELSAAGMVFQLHTHRHRVPFDETLFIREIRDNRIRLEQFAGTKPVHFCYPSGIHEPEFLLWLRQEHVASATTCEAGLASRDSDPLLLPRFVDTYSQSPIEFASWLTGIGALIPRKPRRRKRAVALATVPK
jgi:peptidoglycan/xylan/chitin deacetylase (PgdA/CDA1 family)